MTRRFTASDGLQIAFDDQGRAIPLLCLAGLTRNMEDFAPILGPLGDRARIIRMDYRGRGLSDFDPNPLNYNLIREAMDALELLGHLGIDRAVFLGTSRGGLIAMGLAPMQRARMLGVILNDIGPVIMGGGLAAIMGYVGNRPVWRSYDEAASAMAVLAAATFPGVDAAAWRPWTERWYIEIPGARLGLRYDPQLRAALIAQGVAPVDLWPFFDALAGLPLAVIRGAYSNILSAATMDQMQARHPGLIAATVPARGHVPFLDEPESLDAIRRLLDQVDTHSG